MAASGDANAFQAALCDAIAVHLSMITGQGLDALLSMSSSNTKLKTWIAYRIKGARSEKHDGVICAETQRTALMEAYKVFNATAEYQRRRVYVREVQEWGTKR